MGERYNVDPSKLLETLKETVFKGANESQLMALCIVANEFNLNPFVKEIYAFPAKGGGIVPVVSIDGWLRRINEHPQFDGMEFSFEGTDPKPVSCTCSMYRKDRSRPVVVTEYYAECYRSTDPWNQAPRRMLRHKAIIQCARVCLGFAGNDPDDGEFIHEREVKGREVKAARVPELLPPKEEPAPEPTSARGAVERLAKAGGVEMADVFSAMIGLEIADAEACHVLDDVSPTEWARAESRWQELLTEAQTR
jgi:phage recombination protein Bet